MSTEFDHKVEDAEVSFLQFGGDYRLTSKVFHFMAAYDLEHGVDIWLDQDCSDEELGIAVRRCADASRRIANDQPIIEDKTKYNKLWVQWRKDAAKRMGVRSMKDIWVGANTATIFRNHTYFALRNGAEDKPGNVTEAHKNHPEFLQILLKRDCSDEELGAVARRVINAMIRPVK